MAVRSFTAPDGTEWNVWEVIPEEMTDPRGNGSHLPREMVDGWLCFAGGGEKRRLYPRPPHWAEQTDDGLWEWCQTAVPVMQRPERTAAEEAAARTAVV
ncbi:MAG TPA: hypothetical protein VF665_03965 [Longimicrobium sp.]|jgi:hypothetical protein|uniref:hypothetical protein n=1 Tax=Longimicrobium sp. TaxID=2029185 RepID=UPI002EDA7A0F